METAFYVPDGDAFVATALTRGPWRHDAQHAGPLAALVGRCLEHDHPRDDARIARVTLEILGPVPITALEVESRVRRPGRNVELLEAALRPVGGRDALLARAWRVRTTKLDVPAPPPAPPPPPPSSGLERSFFPGMADVGWHTGMEIRFVTGSFNEPGPACAWLRPRQAVVAGEEPSPLERVLAAADAGNGLSSPLDFGAHLFVNTDLTVHLDRAVEGDWVYLDARTLVSTDGTGRSDSVVGDRRGSAGRALQTLFVAAREA